MLHMLDQHALASTMLPLGTHTKAHVRELAAQLGMRTASKPDSQDVCFITSKEGRGSFLSRRVELTPGRVVDRDGHQVGQVDAVELVTIGQRRGLDVPGGSDPRFAISVDASTATVVVGSAADLLTDAQAVGPISWAAEPVTGEVTVQCSAHGKPAAAVIEPIASGVMVRWAQPHRRIAPGQSIVFYEGDEVLGGGPASALS